MKDINPTTQKTLGWLLGAVSLLHAIAHLWGSATWSLRLEDNLEPDFGELAPFVQENIGSRGAVIEFLLAVLAALACVGWVLVARWGYAPAFLRGWKGRPVWVGGGTVVLLYLVAATLPLLVILNPHNVERIPSWNALGAGGDATFLAVFLIDAIAVAWWTFDRARQPQKQPARRR
jgi:hypothetical protein